MEVTPEQISMVLESYEPVKEKAFESGRVLFIRLFEILPNGPTYFAHISPNVDELFENPVFRAHCAKVINSLGTLVENLAANEPSKNDAIMEKLAVIHRNRYVKPEHTKYVTKALMDILKFEPGSPLEQAWLKVTDTLFGAYNKKLKEAWES